MAHTSPTNRVRLLHLSDLHFGPRHMYSPASLADFLIRDLSASSSWWQRNGLGHDGPILLAISGDLTESAEHKQFGECRELIRRLLAADICGSRIKPEHVFVVPGNHDVEYELDNSDDRLRNYLSFRRDLTDGLGIPTPVALRVDLETSVVVAELNSCRNIFKGPGAEKGHFSDHDLMELDGALAAVPLDELRRCIRIAIVHHHPVLVPELVEPGRGYDAIDNGRLLVDTLRRHGFHIVLHGHKHYPSTFSIDSESALSPIPRPSVLFVSSGTTGSTELPRFVRPVNTYNVIGIAWDKESGETRARVVTRGLVATEGDGLLPQYRWVFNSLCDTTRDLRRALDRVDAPSREPTGGRGNELARLRGNVLACAVVAPPDQLPEARVSLVSLKTLNAMIERPCDVQWSTAPLLENTVQGLGSAFAAAFRIRESTLIRAQLRFADGKIEDAHVYATLADSGATAVDATAPAIASPTGSEAEDAVPRYCLLVESDPEAWERLATRFSRDRFLEYTTKDLRTRFEGLSIDAIAALKAMPCIFAYETSVGKPARLGRIGDISVSADGVKVAPRLDDGARPIDNSLLLVESDAFDIGRFELNRTHVAIKDVSLVAVLAEATRRWISRDLEAFREAEQEMRRLRDTLRRLNIEAHRNGLRGTPIDLEAFNRLARQLPLTPVQKVDCELLNEWVQRIGEAGGWLATSQAAMLAERLHDSLLRKD